MDNKKTIGQRINSALAMRGMQQKELAKTLGVTDNTISYFCSGARTPNALQLLAIANALDVSTDYLYGKTNDGDYSSNKKTAVASAATGLDTDTIKILSAWSDNETRRKALNALLTSAEFDDAMENIEIACDLQSSIAPVPSETKSAVKFFNRLAVKHGGKVELIPSDTVKFYRQEAVECLSDAIKSIIANSNKEGAENG